MISIVRMNVLFFMVTLFLGMGASFVFAQKSSPNFTVEYYVVEKNTIKSFDDYGKSVYSFWPTPKSIVASGFDVIPVLSEDSDSLKRWMNLDSVLVTTSHSVISYVIEKDKSPFSLQNFIKGVDNDGSISLFFSPQLEKPNMAKLFVANEGSLPISIRTLFYDFELGQGDTDSIFPAMKLWVTPKTQVGEVYDGLYVNFSVVFDKDAYQNSGRYFYAMPSQASLDALDSLHFVKQVTEEIDIETPLKKALAIFESEGFLDVSFLSFRLEFFPSSHKWLRSFVFEKDLDSTFYDDSWIDMLSVNSYDSHFPKVYRNGACFNGWTIKTRNLGGKLFKSSDFNMGFLKRDDEYLDVSPLWKYGSECGSVTVSQIGSHGYLELLQIVGKDTIKYDLNKPLKVPYNKNGIPFIVHAVPDSAYELENAYNGKIYVSKNMLLKPKFVPTPDPEPLKIKTPGLEISGNALRLRFETGEMNIFRKINIRVVVASENGTLLDSMLVDSVKTPVFKGEWSYYPLPVGKFRVLVKVSHDKGSAVYIDSTKVINELAFEAGAWNMVSLANVDTKKLKWDKDQLFYHWDESYGGAEFWQYRSLRKKDKPEPTDGYWYSSNEGRSLELLSELKSNASFSWALDSLNSGWNLVSNPHGYYVDLNASSVLDSVEFWRWNSKTKEYEIPKVLAPYEAVWARVSHFVLWKVSGEPIFEKSQWNSLMKPSSGLFRGGNSDGWMFRIVLSDNEGKKDSWNFLGASSEESYSYDPPQAMGDHVNLSIVQGERYLAKSVLKKHDSMDLPYEWALEMNSTHSQEGFISLEETSILRAQGFRVFLTMNGKLLELKDGERLKVNLSEIPQKIRVRVAKKAETPVFYAIENLHTKQIARSLIVTFDASNGFFGVNSQLELLDFTGKKLQSIDFSSQMGLNEKKLDNVKPGLYVVRLKVGNRHFVSKVAVK